MKVIIMSTTMPDSTFAVVYELLNALQTTHPQSSQLSHTGTDCLRHHSIHALVDVLVLLLTDAPSGPVTRSVSALLPTLLDYILSEENQRSSISLAAHLALRSSLALLVAALLATERSSKKLSIGVPVYQRTHDLLICSDSTDVYMISKCYSPHEAHS
jgi:hypothetical protein